MNQIESIDLVSSAVSGDPVLRPPIPYPWSMFRVVFVIEENFMDSPIGRASYFATLAQVARMIREQFPYTREQVEYAWVSVSLPWLTFHLKLRE